MEMSPDIPSHPKIFGDLRLDQLRISGAVYHTVGDAPSTPTLIVLANKTRRWELVISDAYETDRKGKPLNIKPSDDGKGEDGPDHMAKMPTSASSALAPETPEGQRVKKLEELLRQGLEVNGDLHSALCGAQKTIAELESDNKFLAEKNIIRQKCIEELEIERRQDRRIISDQQAELVRLRSNHNLTDKETNHVHVPCPCTVPPTPHCQWCGATLPIEPEPDCKLCELVGKAVSHCVKCSHAFGAPPEPDEDRIREAREKRDESDERRHDAARQHAEGG